jgi:hypothetical protein
MLQRLRELAVQSANGTYTYEDRMQIQQEVKQLVDEVDRIASQAEFNTMKLLRGGLRRVPEDPNLLKGTRTWNYEEAKKDASPPVRPIDPAEPDPTIHNTVRANEPADGPTPSSKGGVIFHIGANMDHREQFYIENMSSYALGLAKGPYTHDAEKRELQLDYRLKTVLTEQLLNLTRQCMLYQDKELILADIKTDWSIRLRPLTMLLKTYKRQSHKYEMLIWPKKWLISLRIRFYLKAPLLC